MAEATPEAGKSSESMEDILQSIKRIIEDDTTTEAKPAADAQGSDVLDLTQVIKEAEPPAAPPAPPAAAPAAPGPKVTPAAPTEDVVKSIDAMFAAPPEKPPEPAAQKPADKLADRTAQKPATPLASSRKQPLMEDGLVSEETAQAAAAALKTIADSAPKDFSIPQIPSSQMRDGTTVEDLILEALKPMLKAWLDENLPVIVQKIVEKEVKRLVAFHSD